LTVWRNARRLYGGSLGVGILKGINLRFAHPYLAGRYRKEPVCLRRYFTGEADAESLLAQNLKELVKYRGGSWFNRTSMFAGERQQNARNRRNRRQHSAHDSPHDTATSI
jgi:hypothetical protein